jgi:hypothetical protein
MVTAASSRILFSKVDTDRKHRMSNAQIESGHTGEGLADIPTMLDWLCEANELPGKTPITRALAILGLAERLDRQTHILLTPQGLREIGLNRTSAYRACRELERAGLISVRRCQGSSPMVSLRTRENDS